MDFRAVLIVLCLLTVQAVCGPVRNRAIERALNATIQVIQEEIQSTLEHLDVPGLLPNVSCLSLNFSELVRPEQQNLTAHHLSSFGCHMEEVSKFVPELSLHLLTICQIIQDMEHLWTGKTVSRNCSLPSFEQDLDRYVYTKCLLQLVDEWLSKAKF